MKTTQYLLATLKETPADAETVSHQLMLRAGMIRQVTSGIYTWLPTGLRVLKKVEQIVREEMNQSGALELLMPAIQPAELWEETGRWQEFGDLMLKIKDRHERDFCFGPTHEEVITDTVRFVINSYKQLPLTFYQIQTKFRDEVRPRFGVMRAREFMMKDAYSFHLTPESLQAAYDLMYKTYARIFTRLGLNFRAVLADTGAIGGNFSHEFQVLADSGEDLIAFSDKSDYAANIEKATALPPQVSRPEPSGALEKIDTPNMRTIDALVTQLNMPIEKTVKTLLVAGKEHEMVALILRGDHALNVLKAEKHPLVASPLKWASEERIKAVIGCGPGSLGPIDMPVPVLVDFEAAVLADFMCGANAEGKHWKNVNWERDLPLPEVLDLRNVEPGDLSPDGEGSLHFTRGIEVGHIFQLGDKYSKAMQAAVLDETGKPSTLFMGCYGIGVSRIVAAAIEQNHDDRGIIWPESMAPFQIALVPLQYQKPPVREAADHLYAELVSLGFEVLMDDRDERPGVKFADMELLGIPHRLVISERGLEAGTIEYKNRRENETYALDRKAVVETLRHRVHSAHAKTKELLEGVALVVE